MVQGSLGARQAPEGAPDGTSHVSKGQEQRHPGETPHPTSSCRGGKLRPGEGQRLLLASGNLRVSPPHSCRLFPGPRPYTGACPVAPQVLFSEVLPLSALELWCEGRGPGPRSAQAWCLTSGELGPLHCGPAPGLQGASGLAPRSWRRVPDTLCIPRPVSAPLWDLVGQSLDTGGLQSCDSEVWGPDRHNLPLCLSLWVAPSCLQVLGLQSPHTPGLAAPVTLWACPHPCPPLSLALSSVEPQYLVPSRRQLGLLLPRPESGVLPAMLAVHAQCPRMLWGGIPTSRLDPCGECPIWLYWPGWPGRLCGLRGAPAGGSPRGEMGCLFSGLGVTALCT